MPLKCGFISAGAKRSKAAIGGVHPCGRWLQLHAAAHISSLQAAPGSIDNCQLLDSWNMPKLLRAVYSRLCQLCEGGLATQEQLSFLAGGS